MTKQKKTRVHPKMRAEWRDWLEKNHDTLDGVWLVSYKKDTGKLVVSYEDSVKEALCFGWVDSRPNKLDDERFERRFSPRDPQAPWSKLNKTYVEALKKKDLMTEAGLAVIEKSKENGAWTIYDSVERLEVPDDLQAALGKNKKAKENFDAFPDSSKKNILWWLKSTKSDATRRKRINKTVSMAAEGKRANHYRQT